MLDADYIIIGAGLAGAATAYHLRQLKKTRVIILEQESTAGTHSSGRNAALIRSHVEDEAIQPLISEGAAALCDGKMAPVQQVGSILLGMGNSANSVDVSQYVPPARGHGLYSANDGVIDVAALLQFYLRGQDLRVRTRVESWRQTSRGVEVETNQGTLRARVLINAAGAWAGRLGRLPLTPYLRHLYVTAATADIDPNWPFVWDVRGGLYFRPESGGLLLCACDERANEPGDYTESWELVGKLIEKVDALQPGLRAVTDDLNMQYRWAGQRTFAPDRNFVIGYDHRHPALFWVAALGGHGVTSSPAVGRLAAELLLAGPEKVSPFGPERLADAADQISAIR